MITLALLFAIQDDAAQAGRIVEKCWLAARGSLERLGVADLDKVRESYLKSAKEFEKRCAALPAEKRDALEKLENPLAGLDAANEGLEGSKKLWAPSIGSYVRKERDPLPAGADSRFLAKLAGRWTNEWKAARESRTWTIAPNGEVEEEFVRGETRKTERIKLSFKKEGRIGVLRGTTNQEHVFLFDGDTFYLGSNLLYDVHPVPDPANFRISSEWEFVVVDDRGCLVVADSGLSVAGAVTLDDRTLTLKFQFPNKKHGVTRTYHRIAGHLVHGTIVEAGTFRRAK